MFTFYPKTIIFALVPPLAHPGLEVLFDLLQQDRDEAFGKVKAMLESKAYKKQIKSIQKLFENPKGLPKRAQGRCPVQGFCCRSGFETI